jgi:hypothetical protein
MWWYRALAVFLLLKMSGWVGDSVLNVVCLVPSVVHEIMDT